VKQFLICQLLTLIKTKLSINNTKIINNIIDIYAFVQNAMLTLDHTPSDGHGYCTDPKCYCAEFRADNPTNNPRCKCKHRKDVHEIENCELVKKSSPQYADCTLCACKVWTEESTNNLPQSLKSNKLPKYTNRICRCKHYHNVHSISTKACMVTGCACQTFGEFNKASTVEPLNSETCACGHPLDNHYKIADNDYGGCKGICQ